jgi:hypothetical protein
MGEGLRYTLYTLLGVAGIIVLIMVASTFARTDNGPTTSAVVPTMEATTYTTLPPPTRTASKPKPKRVARLPRPSPAVDVAKMFPLRPGPDPQHDQRQVVRDWWNTTGQDVVVAELAIGLASAAVESDDLVTASSETKQAQEASDAASHEVLMNIPDGWQDVAEAVFQATTDFASAYSRLHEAIDSNKPSDMADALDQARTAHDEMMHAKHLARVRYAAMGGNPDDLTAAPQ